MIQLLHGTNIPFMKYRRLSYVLSGALMLATFVWLAVNGGPRYSVDFTGGTLLQVKATPAVEADRVRQAFETAGLRGAELQQLTGEHRDEFMIRVGQSEAGDDLFQRISAAVGSAAPGTRLELRRQEVVGPKVGAELREKALWAVLGSLLGILAYVGIRYEFKFALGAVLALFHDVTIVLGLMCFAGRELSLTVVAALLTIAGYSINDTIVTFDRIRELSKSRKQDDPERVMDKAVNETLSRTVITALTVLFTAIALYIWGGEVLNDFSFAMIAGLLTGTYSTVYVATGLSLDLWLALQRRKGVQTARLKGTT